MENTFDIDTTIIRVQNKIKRAQRPIHVYFINGKIVATTAPDEKLVKKLIGVYDGSKKTYGDCYVDEDIRWATRAMAS